MQRPSNKITMVFYDGQKTAKCFELSKAYVKAILILVPSLFFTALFAVLLLFSYIKATGRTSMNNLTMPTKNAIELAKEKNSLQEKQKLLEDDNRKLNEQIKSLNLELQNYRQLAQNTAPTNTNSQQVAQAPQPVATTPQAPPAQVAVAPKPAAPAPVAQTATVKTSAQSKDLSGQGILKIADINVHKMDQGVTVNFNIINPREQKKITGHVLVLVHQGGSTHIYPKGNTSSANYLADFKQGERFTVSRFRPVNAVIQKSISSQSKIDVEVLIYSLSGDLLLKEKRSYDRIR